ncbi:helix-turn-helix transcriptional regulator [Streptosporangium longisporum]|uniref:Helix-turn-helix transcriptional regulator n=1 Tax=Streptosporangium longisporum TaxID=46187 RepID=A0ABN3XPW8_9ACTN
MDNREEVKTFLTSRRAKIGPGEAGLIDSGRRRVPGLRRSEVADLAGVSVEYYAQLERGDLAGVSGSVLDAVARALRLDEAERAHLADLARTAGPAARPHRRRPAQQIRPGLTRILDGMTAIPAMVNNGRLDALAANPLGMALFAPVFADPARPAGQIANHARFTFLHPRAHAFWPDWDRAADDAVATLRTEAGRDPYDKQLSDLVGELSTRSDAFRTRWAAHDVRLHRTGTKHLHHPVVGDLHLTYEVLDLAADPGLSLIAFTAPPGTPDADALELLASWAATHTPADALTPPGRTAT